MESQTENEYKMAYYKWKWVYNYIVQMKIILNNGKINIKIDSSLSSRLSFLIVAPFNRICHSKN